MSMWREPKDYASELAKIQQDDLVMARTDKHNYTSGEPVKIDVLLSHYSTRDLRGAKFSWRVEGGEPRGSTRYVEGIEKPIEQQIAPGGGTTLASDTFDAPAGARPRGGR